MNRKGLALIVVLAVTALISIAAIALYSTVNLEVMIARNKNVLSKAKLSAASGISHFVALETNYKTLREQAGDLQFIQVIPETPLGENTSYEVTVKFPPSLKAGQYIVESVGYYKKGGKIISYHPSKAIFEGEQ